MRNGCSVFPQKLKENSKENLNGDTKSTFLILKSLKDEFVPCNKIRLTLLSCLLVSKLTVTFSELRNFPKSLNVCAIWSKYYLLWNRGMGTFVLSSYIKQNLKFILYYINVNFCWYYTAIPSNFDMFLEWKSNVTH